VGGEKAMSDNVKSASRAFAILEFFRDQKKPCSMSELAQGLDYPRSSSTVLLKTLVKLGYLNYDRRSRNYFPTPKVTGLGDWVPKALFGSGQVIDAMNDLHAATGESVFLGTLNDVYLQYIQTRPSTHILRFQIDEGTIRPVTQSIAGLVLIAAMSPDKLDNIVRRANIATPDPADRVNLDDVVALISDIRAKRYGYVEDLPFEGGATLAVLLPVLVQDQPIVLALGGAVARFRKNYDQYLNALRSAAATVSPNPDSGSRGNGGPA